MAEALKPNIPVCKLVTVGDGGVGKTSFLISYVTGSFPSEYIPTVFDNYAQTIAVDGHEYTVALWDTGGGEDYYRLRPLCYPDTDAFLLCYDVQNRLSFNHIEEEWLPELKHHAPDTPILLVANKIDLKNNRITTEEGKNLAQKHGLTYLECSALTREGIQAVIPTAVLLGFCEGASRKKKSKGFWFKVKRFFSNKTK